MTDHGSTPRLERAREVKRAVTEVARELVHEKAETLLAGKGTRDIFSLLGRMLFFVAHLRYSPSRSQGQHGYRSEEQNDRRRIVSSSVVRTIISSSISVVCLTIISTILLAGHETTSNTLSWTLLELARHPKVQSRLRAEIREMEAAIRARGDTQFTIADFDEMPYTTAVIKVRNAPSTPCCVHLVAS